ncbi:MAG TPA: c-type cytochrome [Pseudolabrys sp.]|nr:c-type cytochrome [Pseudolabrys sp.]
MCGCFQCHQVAGQGNPIGGFPRIGGQSFQYLYASLRNFKSGRRVSDVMQPVVAGYSDEDLRDVAAYYASIRLKPVAASQATAVRNHPSADTLIQGGALAAVGSAKDGVQACANCHGPAGAGLPPVYPFLAGQFAGYLESQLKAFKSNQRHGDGLHIMQGIAKRLSDEQIHAVAEYYASIQPPETIAQTSFAGPAVVGAPLGPLQERANPNGPSASTGQGSGQ